MQVFSKKISMNTPKEKIVEFSNDLTFISKFHHPSIIKYTRFCPVDFDKNPRPVVITNALIKGTLHQFLISGSINFQSSEYDVKKFIIIYGIASAMSYLHSHDIIHCDLSSDNIYLDEKLYPKLTGFQFSQFQATKPPKYSIYRFSKYKGNYEYYSPEIYFSKNYSKASDVFAFSVIRYEIFQRRRLLYDDDFFRYIQDIAINNKRPSDDDDFENVPIYYKELIQKCWSEDQSERPTFDEIVQFLKNDMSLIDNEEYQEYVKYIDESLIDYDSTKEFHFFDDIINSPNQKVEFFQTEKKISDLKKYYKTEQHTNIFGTFYKIYNNDTNEKYSARCSDLPLEHFTENDIVNLTEELSVISQIHHPSIVKFVGYSPLDFFDIPKPTIVNEYLIYYTLKDVLNMHEHIQIWDDTQKLINIYGIASAMSYLHSHNILHRDLKPENICLDDLFFPKLTGFHLSKELPANTDSEICNEIKGTPIYL